MAWCPKNVWVMFEIPKMEHLATPGWSKSDKLWPATLGQTSQQHLDKDMLRIHGFEIFWVKISKLHHCTHLLSKTHYAKPLSVGRSPWSLGFEIAILRLPLDATDFQKETVLQLSYTISVKFWIKLANDDFESPLKVMDSAALGCFDLMPGLARNTSTYLHVASCGFGQHVSLVFQVNKLLA